MVTTDKKKLFDLLKEAFLQQGLDREPHRFQAMDFLEKKGLPTAKSEAYRFTPLVRTLEENFAINPPTSANPTDLCLVPGQKCNQIAFVNGIYSPALNKILDSAISIRTSDSPAPRSEHDPFDLLNQAFALATVEIEVPSHHEVNEPFAIVHYFDQPDFAFANPRWTCRLGKGSKLTLVEYTIAQPATAYFNNKQSTIDVGEHSSLDFIVIQQGSRDEVLMNNTVVNVADAAKAFCYTCTLDGKLVRNNLSLILNGEGIDAHLHGLYLVSGKTLTDNHTVVDHRKPNSYSNELYKGVLDENGKAVFNGKIFVRPDAQKTNAFQSNRNILLSETSTIHTKPQLEIWADDVKCSHGCTTGQLAEEAMFYLRSRGIPKDMARGLLLNAFGAETLEGIRDEAIRAFVGQMIQQKLNSNAES